MLVYVSAGDSLLAGYKDGGPPVNRTLQEVQKLLSQLQMSPDLDYLDLVFLRSRTIAATDFLNFGLNGNLPVHLFEKGNVSSPLDLPLFSKILNELGQGELGQGELGQIKPIDEIRYAKVLGLMRVYLLGTMHNIYQIQQMSAQDDVNQEAEQQETPLPTGTSRPGARMYDFIHETFKDYEDRVNKSRIQLTRALLQATFFKGGFASSPIDKLTNLVGFVRDQTELGWEARYLSRLFNDRTGKYQTQLEYLKSRQDKDMVVELTCFGNEFITGPLFNGNFSQSAEFCEGPFEVDSLRNQDGNWKYGILSESHFDELLEQMCSSLFDEDSGLNKVVFYTVPLFSSLGFLVPTEGAEKKPNGYYSSYSFYLTPNDPYKTNGVTIDHKLMEELDNIANNRNDLIRKKVREYAEQGAVLYDLDLNVRQIHMASLVSEQLAHISHYQGLTAVDFTQEPFDELDREVVELLTRDSKIVFSSDGVHPNVIAHMMIALKRLEQEKQSGRITEEQYLAAKTKISKVGSLQSKMEVAEHWAMPGKKVTLGDLLREVKRHPKALASRTIQRSRHRVGSVTKGAVSKVGNLVASL